jgi:hypothetical protein
VLVVWSLAGASWWVLATGAVVTLTLGALRRRAAFELGALAAVAMLAPDVSAWGWLLLLGAALVVPALQPPPRLVVAGGRGRRVRQVLATAAVALALVGAVALLIEHVAKATAIAEDWNAGMDRTRAQLLPSTPAAALRGLGTAVARSDPAAVCWSMSPVAEAQFSAGIGAPDCSTAVQVLHDRVRDPAAFESPDTRSIAESTLQDGSVIRVDGCSLTWNGLSEIISGSPHSRTQPPPGPQLGVLEVRRELNAGYRITSYAPCN